MLNKLKKSHKGFTIIEVMIVLAIAGLILLIVFLAVPALQRSSRNTQRKNDASAIGAALANWISNNNGTVPKKLGKNASSSILEVCNTGGGATGGATACTGNVETATMGFYTDANVSVADGSAGGVTPTPTVNQVVIETGELCSGNIGGAISSRTAAIFYATESASSASVQCIEQ